MTQERTDQMSVSDLIWALESVLKEHGDLPVLLGDDSRVQELIAYDEDGDTRGKRVEVVIRGY